VIESGGLPLIVGGDIVHFTHQLADETWRSPHDEDQATANATRRMVFDRIEHDGATLATAHLPFAFVRLDAATASASCCPPVRRRRRWRPRSH
jgi:hypothetical protein